MKNRVLHITLLLTLVYLLGCSPKPIFEQQTVYTFELDDTTYQIIGYFDPSGNREGINDLIRKNNGQRFWYRDSNQDGSIDQVINGNLSTNEANSIYQAGITIALSKGQLKEQPYPRKFEITIGNFHYEIISFLVDSPRTYNQFRIYDRTTNSVDILRDLGRDGILEQDNLPEKKYKSFQLDYEHILSIGLDRRLILFDGNMYLVKHRNF